MSHIQNSRDKRKFSCASSMFCFRFLRDLLYEQSLDKVINERPERIPVYRINCVWSNEICHLENNKVESFSYYFRISMIILLSVLSTTITSLQSNNKTIKIPNIYKPNAIKNTTPLYRTTCT